MKLNTAPANAVEMNGVASTNQFTIQASAKAFSILSDGLYANKIRAIIRELSTNALDSHIAAGKADVPFTVNIPNTLFPWFSVRDYGVGLDHDEVVNIYTSYFTSTKTNSDDFVGALGLGSKSPFSYTDNFTVTAIKNGRKGNYSAYIDDTGVPAIALMAETETDEPNGVEVRFSVNDRSDFWRFAREAGTIYRMFEVKPEFTGEKFEINYPDYHRRDIIPGVHLRKGSGTNTIVMGSIEYPVYLSQGVLEDDLTHIDSQNLEIHLPIGAVEMAASREDLSYTPHTVKTISEVYRKIADALSSVFEADIAEIDNVWEKAHFIYKNSRIPLFSEASHAYFRDNPNPLLVSNGRYLSLDVIQYPEKRAQELNIKLHCIEVMYDSTPTRGSRGAERRNDKGQIEYFKAYYIPSSLDVIFVQGDGNAPVSRVKEWAKSNNASRWIILAAPIVRSKPMQWDKFVEDIHNPPASQFMDINSFPKPEKKTRAKSTPVYEFTLERRSWGNYQTVQHPSGNVEDIDVADGTVAYVKLYKHETYINDSAFDLRKAMYKLHSAGLLRTNKLRVFGVRKSEFETVQQMKGWTPFDEAVRNLICSFSEKEFVQMYMKTLDREWQRFYNESSKVKDLLGDSPVMSIADFYDHGCSYEFNEVYNMVKEFGDDGVKEKLEAAMQKVDVVVKQYPLIEHLCGYTDLNLLVDYVKLIDNAKGE